MSIVDERERQNIPDHEPSDRVSPVHLVADHATVHRLLLSHGALAVRHSVPVVGSVR